MNVSVLRRNIAHPTMWDMLFQDYYFENLHAIIYEVRRKHTCVDGDELIVIIDDKVRRVEMAYGSLEAKWLPVTEGTT